MRAIIINPWHRTVTEIEGPYGHLVGMYQGLSEPGVHEAKDIDRVRISQRDCIWVDGEGYMKEGLPIWRLSGYEPVLAGRGLLLGLDEAGENISPGVVAEFMTQFIHWSDEETTGELGPTTEGEQDGFTVVTVGGAILRPRGEHPLTPY